MNNNAHIEIRNKVEHLMGTGFSIEEIAQKLNLPLGTRFLEKSAKWYKYCVVAKRNQKEAIIKHPGLYSKAGKIAQKKHPWIGHSLGKKYGPEQGRINRERLKGNSEYFSMMARKLQEKNPEHSRRNMIKAQETMRKQGTFSFHQKIASLKCIEKHPDQLSEMSKKAHAMYPLALLALESRRKKYPYKFMDCIFDSNDERHVCDRFVKHDLITKPEEGKNVHFRVNTCHIDFFLQQKVFVEYHPPVRYGIKKNETIESYYEERRKLLDENGFNDYPIIIIDSLKNVEPKINEIKELLAIKAH